ncbi:MAG: hypothetical protein AABW99_04005 [archaeon]
MLDLTYVAFLFAFLAGLFFLVKPAILLPYLRTNPHGGPKVVDVYDKEKALRFSRIVGLCLVVSSVLISIIYFLNLEKTNYVLIVPAAFVIIFIAGNLGLKKSN